MKKEILIRNNNDHRENLPEVSFAKYFVICLERKMLGTYM